VFACVPDDCFFVRRAIDFKISKYCKQERERVWRVSVHECSSRKKVTTKIFFLTLIHHDETKIIPLSLTTLSLFIFIRKKNARSKYSSISLSLSLLSPCVCVCVCVCESSSMFKKKPVQLKNDNPRLFFVGLVCLILLYVYRAILLSSSSSKKKNEKKNGTKSDDAKVLDKTRKISAEEVKKHNKVDDLWIIIDKKVYDVTEYAEEHPGGVAAIAKNAGGDASKGFRGPQHPSRVFDIVDDYMIGVLEEKS